MKVLLLLLFLLPFTSTSFQYNTFLSAQARLHLHLPYTFLFLLFPLFFPFFSCFTITIRSGLKSVPQNAKTHYNYANLQKDLGNIELAMQHYRRALRWEWNEVTMKAIFLYLLLCSACFQSISSILALFLALSYFSLLSRDYYSLWPDHASAHNNLGTLLCELSEMDEAERHFKAALAINPFHPRAHFNLANIYR